MWGTGSKLGRSRDEGRFYNAGKARKNQNRNHQQQKQHHNRIQRSEWEVSEPSNSIPMVPSQPLIASHYSNLEKFLESIIPSVPAQYLSKRTMRGSRTCDVEFQPYFVLGDLWDSFREWSAYGAEVPLVLNRSDSAVQYYVPFLSGIQLYVESEKKIAKSRDSSSDGSSDCEVEKDLECSREASGGIGTSSLRDNLSAAQEGSSTDECEARNSRGHLVFEFLDRDTPHNREPLVEKMSDLSRRYPQLKTLRSCDLLPTSWVSVAWYPIYRIPMGPPIRDLDASFLTYHSLSTPMGGSGSAQERVVVNQRDIHGVPRISLPAFAMAAYKFRGSVWIQNGVHELQLASSQTRAAENWLTLLGVNHPDFQFFASHATYFR